MLVARRWFLRGQGSLRAPRGMGDTLMPPLWPLLCGNQTLVTWAGVLSFFYPVPSPAVHCQSGREVVLKQLVWTPWVNRASEVGDTAGEEEGRGVRGHRVSPAG